jgi:hypothetical protein
MLFNFESVKHERIHEHLDPMASQNTMKVQEWKTRTPKWQSVMHTGQTGVTNWSDRFEPSAGHLRILEDQRLST